MRDVEVIFHSELPDAEVKRRKYAFPEERRFPLTDRAHVMSAIRFFNYAKPDEEAHLAKAILKRMRELGITDVNVGKDNRFKEYYERSMRHGDEMTTKPIFSDDRDEYLEHYGVKGMKWHKHIMANLEDEMNSSGLSRFNNKIQNDAIVKRNQREYARQMIEARKKTGGKSPLVKALHTKISGGGYEAKLSKAGSAKITRGKNRVRRMLNFKQDVAEGKREWSYDKDLKRATGTVSTAVRSAKRNKPYRK